MADFLKNIEVVGPFWSAIVDVTRLVKPRWHRTYRNLFISRTRQTAFGERDLLLPGTFFVLGSVRWVRLRPGKFSKPEYIWRRPGNEGVPLPNTLAEIEDYLRTGQLSLLLIQADRNEWPQTVDNERRSFTFLAGDINLDRLQPEKVTNVPEDARERLYRALNLTPPTPAPGTPAETTAWHLSVHSSGLSIYGQAELPWRLERVTAPFLVTRLSPDPRPSGSSDTVPGFRMSIEVERLSAQDKARLLQAWQQLCALLNPTNLLNATLPSAAPSTWVTLEVANPLDIPRLHWEIIPWQEKPDTLPLHFERGEINLLLSDQQPDDQDTPPTTLARIVLDQFIFVDQTIEISAGTKPGGTVGKLNYTAHRSAGNLFQEEMALTATTLTFDPIEVPKFLREAQALPQPEWVSGKNATPLDQPLLWGFMPLEDGWGQLPIPNLTEQIYLDTNLARLTPSQAPAQTALLQGAVAFGNDRRSLLGDLRNEHGWRIVVLDAAYIKGRWTLVTKIQNGTSQVTAPAQAHNFDTEQLEIGEIHLEIFSPEVVVDGLIWLSSHRPTPQDALPDLTNWISGLRSIPLRSTNPEQDLFAPALTTVVDHLTFSLKVDRSIPYAGLGAWSCRIQPVEQVISALEAAGVMPLASGSQESNLPLVWKRHPTLPMIQALPLTQSQTPPNHPSASRQLAPFELLVGLPWQFGVNRPNGAATWPRFSGPARPASAWQRVFDLPLAALSMPGLILEPANSDETLGLPTEQALQLLLQLRYDLPYTDELNALAQLPKPARDPREVSPLPDSPPPQQARPLQRETLAGHWQSLSEKASLAAIDAADAFIFRAERLMVQYLIEPGEWPVEAAFSLENYPGSLSLRNHNHPEAETLILEENAALKGISGYFVPADDQTLQQIRSNEADKTTSFEIVAGSMAAHLQSGKARDQRGLIRTASQAHNGLIITPVELIEAEDQSANQAAFVLTSTLASLRLDVGDGHQWQLWFRDLPVKLATFDRSRLNWPGRQDVNDPEALSRAHNFLSGYEWRLRDEVVAPTGPSGPLSLNNLHFYPLTLEKVSFDAQNHLTQVEIIGRLQLPQQKPAEQIALSNAVRLVFAKDPQSTELILSEVHSETSLVEWPLASPQQALDPQLEWEKITYNAENKSLQLEAAFLKFFLFETQWRVSLGPISFLPNEQIIVKEIQFASDGNAIAPRQLTLTLDLKQAFYEASLSLGLSLGRQEHPVLTADLDLTLTAFQSAVIKSLKLFDKVPLSDYEFTINSKAIQIVWDTYQVAPDQADLYFLPGMAVTPPRVPGFAALTFEATSGEAVGGAYLPKLILQSCFAEVLLFCRWGDFLQTQRPASTLTTSQVFGSSAGDMVISYTTEWLPTHATWLERCLLNGFLELRSLISWPKSLAFDDVQSTVTLPAVRPQQGLPDLNHIRQSMRILFNQHSLPVQQLAAQANDALLLFNLAPDHSWQFLAVVEHQLLEIKADPTLTMLAGKRDLRWTVTQEVRLMHPATFQDFIHTGSARVLDPVADFASEHDLHGYFRQSVQDLLTKPDAPDRLAKLPGDTLLVEAGAPHYLQLKPLAQVGQTGSLPPTTALQFLPNGSQFGILSSPHDYAPDQTNNAGWLLLTTPFLGRLQHPQYDGLDLTDGSHTNLTALQMDPILQLHHRRQTTPSAERLPGLPLTLSSWGDKTSVKITLSPLDWPVARTWLRLDPISLQENWFRLHNLFPEPVGGHLESVIAALPDTPARLSRAVALRRAFDSFKPFYPPRLPDNYQLPAEIQEEAPVWRQDSTLVIQHTDKGPIQAQNGYVWHGVGLQILNSRLFQDDVAEEVVQRRYAAATILPAQSKVQGRDNLKPLSLAISPYVGLELKLRPVGGVQLQTKLVSAELICLSPASATLQPTASQLREVENDELVASNLNWARETHRRLSPHSPVAVLRFRKIKVSLQADPEREAILATDFSFALVQDLQLAQPLTKHPARLRSQINLLRFREGQFGGCQIPTLPHPFELAAPQMIGVQPLYLDEATIPSKQWPWGLSALRLGVLYTHTGRSIIGKFIKPSTEVGGATLETGTTLWWQVPQHIVQYRSGFQSRRPAAGLPALFRAQAIKSLLPVLPAPPLPSSTSDTLYHLLQSADDPWQPVLPGRLRYLLTGNRAGAMLALRHQLLRQRSNGPTGDEVMISGSVPVQHRVPRPVSLPDNTQTSRALQTWASYFEPKTNLRLKATPTDEAFLAECKDEPARRLQMTLLNPYQGAVDSEWTGELEFAMENQRDGEEREKWQVELKLIIAETVISYPLKFVSESSSTVLFTPAPSPTKPADRIRSMKPGDVILAQARVKPSAETNGFAQTLTFILRVADEIALPLPLKPYFIHFEDPEYNRLLASPAAQGVRLVRLKRSLADGQSELVDRTLMISADRRAYNSDSQLFVRYDWEAGTEGSIKSDAKIEISLIDPDGNPTLVQYPNQLTPTSGRCGAYEPGKLYPVSLGDLMLGTSRLRLQVGDVIELKFIICAAHFEATPDMPALENKVEIVLRLDIIAEPVNPVPEAAYALLRWQTIEQDRQVECARFAWSPQPSRIELVCPDDLVTGIVRRRAVFQWTDTVRPGTLGGYAIQKITQTGSTHFPTPIDSPKVE